MHPRGALPTVLHRAAGSRTGQALRKRLAGLLAPLTDGSAIPHIP